MRWPRPPRPVRQWLRRWALEAVRALDAWEDDDVSGPTAPSGAPAAWLDRVRAAPEVHWTRAGAGTVAPVTPARPGPPAVSGAPPAVSTSSDKGAAPPRGHAAPTALTFSARPPVTDSRPVFPEHPAPPCVVRTEVLEVRPRVSAAPTWGTPAQIPPPLPLHWPASVPTLAPSPWISAAPDVATSPLPAWPNKPELARETSSTAWPQPSSSAAPAPTFSSVNSADHGADWRATSDDQPPADGWPELPGSPQDVLERWHAAQREQERWRELEREQAGERWNGSVS